MKKTNELPDIIVDLTDDNKTVEEAIAECEAARQVIKPWYIGIKELPNVSKVGLRNKVKTYSISDVTWRV